MVHPIIVFVKNGKRWSHHNIQFVSQRHQIRKRICRPQEKRQKWIREFDQTSELSVCGA